MTSREKVDLYFKDEINSIQNLDIKEFVYRCFEQLCPDYFWTVPASTSGKYHPSFALGESGLIRHVRVTFWWALEIANAWPENVNIDEVKAAVLLHDVLKNGEDFSGTKTDSTITNTHGILLANKIQDTEYKNIVDSIRGHMGRWTIPFEESCWKINTPITLIVHLADYCASRKIEDLIDKLIREKNNGTTAN